MITTSIKLWIAPRLVHGRQSGHPLDGRHIAVAQIPPVTSKPAKNKSTERIDGIVAAIMAIGRAMVAQEEPQPEYSMFFV